ncbi:hypothetical protein DPX16_21301 [Anabarilius grahami]|uniref:DDE Tnp4 domain-containing protein n=1 Tax=Anabarilius grahami TaxID=495550 RepID=A0A3N0Y0R0_ANAGA|nr:hypothetical protein DPX16_21301 [Anabarilius grahami]
MKSSLLRRVDGFWQQALFHHYSNGITTLRCQGLVFGSADLDHQIRNLTHREDIEQPFMVPMVVDHDYGASRTVCVDREQFPSYEHLMAFWNLIKAATAKMVRVTRAKKTYSTSTESPLTRPTKLLPIDELFLFLTYLSTGCTQRELGHRFNIHRATVSRIIVTWANILYSLLGSVCIWMSPADVKANLPSDFDGSYSDTQVLVDCTELRCQTPSSPLLQSEVYSNYKSHCTFKAMVGMSLHGALTFVSALFEGSMSDREVFRQSGITSLLTLDMAIMVDKGFLVDDLVPGTVHHPAFLSKRAQMSEVNSVNSEVTCGQVW